MRRSNVPRRMNAARRASAKPSTWDGCPTSCSSWRRRGTPAPRHRRTGRPPGRGTDRRGTARAGGTARGRAPARAVRRCAARCDVDDLESRLLAEPLGRGGSHAARPDVGRSVGELLDRRDAGVGELAGLVAPHPGDEAQVVVVAPAAVAHARPAAQRAVADRVRVGLGVGGERRLELGSHRAVVGGELPQREGASLHGAEPDVDVVRWVSLDPGDVLGVRGELEQRRGLDLPGELRVLDPVAPRCEVARSVDLHEEVRTPIHRPSKNVAWKVTSTPACIASTVRRSSSVSSAALTFSSPRSISTTSSPPSLQVGEVAQLVLGAPARQHVELRIVPLRAVAFIAGGRTREHRELFARHEPDEVRGAEDEGPAVVQHVSCPSTVPRGRRGRDAGSCGPRRGRRPPG